MKSSLLLLSVVTVLSLGTPAYSQYVYMDVNGDSVCTSGDVLTSAVTAVDVYLDTNHNAHGNTVTCAANSSEPFDVLSYDLLFHFSGQGSVTYQSYTNGAQGFVLANPLTVDGSDAGVGYAAPAGGKLAPGRYMLGTLGISVAGAPNLNFIAVSTNPTIPSRVTGFGSTCDATEFPNEVTLGEDFIDNCGLAIPTDVQATSWGKIKQLYR